VPVSIELAADEVGMLVQRAAETVLGQVNPYELAAYRFVHRDYDETIEIAERIIQDPSVDFLHKKFRRNSWGAPPYDRKKYDEATAKFQKAVELDPKFAPSYHGWGVALDDQKKYDEAIAKYQKAIELD